MYALSMIFLSKPPLSSGIFQACFNYMVSSKSSKRPSSGLHPEASHHIVQAESAGA